MKGTHGLFKQGGLGVLGVCRAFMYTCSEGVSISLTFNHCFLLLRLPCFAPQRWRRKASFIQHSVIGLCLEAQPTQLVTSKCQADAPAQQWQLLPQPHT